MSLTPYSIALGGVTSRRMTRHTLTLKQLADSYKQPGITLPLTVKQYAALAKKDRSALKQPLPYFVGGIFEGPRSDANLVARTLLTLDIEDPSADVPPPPPAHVADMLDLLGLEGWVYTSLGHTPQAPRYRVVLPLSEYVTDVHTLEATTLHAAEALQVLQWCQPESYVLSQPMFLPVRLSDGVYSRWHIPGNAWSTVSRTKPKPKETKALADIPDECPDHLLNAIKHAGLYIRQGKEGQHFITCPFVDQHDNENDTQTVYMQANYNGYTHPSVRCFDTAPDTNGNPHLTIKTLTRWLTDSNHLTSADAAASGVLEDVEAFWQSADASFALDREPAKRSWAIEGFAPIGLVTMVTGPGGQGKSMLMMQLAVHASMGRKWGEYDIRLPIKTLCLSYEDDALELHRRARVVATRAISDDDIGSAAVLYRKNFRMFAAGQDLTDSWTLLVKADRSTTAHTPRVSWLIDVLKHGKVKLLTIDPAVFTHSVEENSNTDIAAYMRMLTHVAREAQCAIVIVHHAGKATMGTDLDDLDQTAARGAGAFADNARSVSLCVSIHSRDALTYGLPSVGRFMIVKHVKSNYSAPMPDMVLEHMSRDGSAWLEHRPEYRKLDEGEIAEVKQELKTVAEKERMHEHMHKVLDYLDGCDGEVSITQIKEACLFSHARYVKSAVIWLEQQDYVEVGKDGNRILVTMLDSGRKHLKFVRSGL